MVSGEFKVTGAYKGSSFFSEKLEEMRAVECAMKARYKCTTKHVTVGHGLTTLGTISFPNNLWASI